MTDVFASVSTRDQLEADCRMAMTKAAQIKVRGFDTQKLRSDAIARVDDLLDLYNGLYVSDPALR